jgi:hypothetical protein
VANPAKTDLITLNQRKKEKETNSKIQVGSIKVEKLSSSKLLGIIMDDDQ